MITLIAEVANEKQLGFLRQTLENLLPSFEIDLLCLAYEEVYLQSREKLGETCAEAGRECLVWAVPKETDGFLEAEKYLTKKNPLVFLWRDCLVRATGLKELLRLSLLERGLGVISGDMNEPLGYTADSIYQDLYKLTAVHPDGATLVDTVEIRGVLCKTPLFVENYKRSGGGLAFGIELRRLGYKNLITNKAIYRR